MDFLGIREAMKQRVPAGPVGTLRRWRRAVAEKRYFKQGVTTLRVGRFDIVAPKNHALGPILATQPYRDLCVGVTAKHVSRKYPHGTMIDIGANIGDTAAIIATYAGNKLILVEASDYFFKFLVENAQRLPNHTELRKTLVADGTAIVGAFKHWGGTASFTEGDFAAQVQSTRLCDLADAATCFVKLDTDGYDFRILEDSLTWLSNARPAVLFESQIRSREDLEGANKLFASMMNIGYSHFVVWDDPGFHLLSTSSLDILTDLNRYLFKVWERDVRRSICNYDVLCLHEDDKDLYAGIARDWKTYSFET